MGVKPKIAPVSIIRAVIDLDLIHGQDRRGTADDVVELS